MFQDMVTLIAGLGADGGGRDLGPQELDEVGGCFESDIEGFGKGVLG